MCFHFSFRGTMKGHSRIAFLPSELAVNRCHNLWIADEGFKWQTAAEQNLEEDDYEGNEEAWPALSYFTSHGDKCQDVVLSFMLLLVCLVHTVQKQYKIVSSQWECANKQKGHRGEQKVRKRERKVIKRKRQKPNGDQCDRDFVFGSFVVLPIFSRLTFIAPIKYVLFSTPSVLICCLLFF